MNANDVKDDACYNEAISCLCSNIRAVLGSVQEKHKRDIQEIRLRVLRPLAVYRGSRQAFVDKEGALLDNPVGNCVIVSKDDIESSFRSLCRYSVHAHQQEISDGYISIKGGHRAGICGTAVLRPDGFGMRDITSINLRVAREIRGCADAIISGVFSEGLCGVIIAGPPSSGKTTLLRDLARQLSSGAAGRYYKVVIVDERSEIGAVHSGFLYNDIGAGCDILDGYQKGAGLMMAVRTLSPEIVICDEIGMGDEIEAVRMGLNSGVCLVTSIHAANRMELARKPQYIELMRTGGFKKLVFLRGSGCPGEISGIYDLGR